MTTPEDSRQSDIRKILNDFKFKGKKLGLGSELPRGANADERGDDADEADDQREGADSDSP